MSDGSLEKQMKRDLVILINDIYDDIFMNVPGFVKNIIRKSLVAKKVEVFAKRITELSCSYVEAKLEEFESE